VAVVRLPIEICRFDGEVEPLGEGKNEINLNVPQVLWQLVEDMTLDLV
jgi:hypothetical protein